MGPKVEAASEFAGSPGRIAAIGALEDASAILRGDAGTTISHDIHHLVRAPPSGP